MECWPTDSQYPITTQFNQAGELWLSGYHTGVDIACPVGTPIYAAFDGQVSFAGSASRYGGLICLTDKRGTIIKYAHLSEIGVGYGESVVKGQLIGKTGNTGNTTGPHLHFEVQVNGQLCDPSTWLKSPGEPGKENY